MYQGGEVHVFARVGAVPKRPSMVRASFCFEEPRLCDSDARLYYLDFNISCLTLTPVAWLGSGLHWHLRAQGWVSYGAGQLHCMAWLA